MIGGHKQGEFSFVALPALLVTVVIVAPLSALLTVWLYLKFNEFAFIALVLFFPILSAWLCITVGGVRHKSIAVFEAILVCGTFCLFYLAFIEYLPFGAGINKKIIYDVAEFIAQSFAYIIRHAYAVLNTQSVFLFIFLLLLIVVMFVDRVDSVLNDDKEDSGLFGKHTMYFDAVNGVRLFEAMRDGNYGYISSLGKFSREPKSEKHSEIVVDLTKDSCHLSVYNKRPCMADDRDYFYDSVMIDFDIDREIGKKLIMK